MPAMPTQTTKMTHIVFHERAHELVYRMTHIEGPNTPLAIYVALCCYLHTASPAVRVSCDV